MYRMGNVLGLLLYIRFAPNTLGVFTQACQTDFRSALKPVSSIHTEISLAQTDLDPTHLAM